MYFTRDRLTKNALTSAFPSAFCWRKAFHRSICGTHCESSHLIGKLDGFLQWSSKLAINNHWAQWQTPSAWWHSQGVSHFISIYARRYMPMSDKNGSQMLWLWLDVFSTTNKDGRMWNLLELLSALDVIPQTVLMSPERTKPVYGGILSICNLV